MNEPSQVLQLHLMTEKSLKLKEAENAYVFRVARKANKSMIKMAVEKAFSVKVDRVRTLIVPGKPKRLGRFEGRTVAWKKAIVILKKDQKIADFDNV
jgi:large subunit ribosomal protein L23